MAIVILKTTIFITFAALYITGNTQMEWLARSIKKDIIRPYTNQYDIIYTTPTPEVLETENEIEIESEKEPIMPTITSDVPIVVVITATPVPSTITEDDLWDALLGYRSTHGKGGIHRSDSLCQYARMRADELYKRALQTPEDPLDNHAGFVRDAESGYIFELTNYSYVGENLAYLPNTTNATQVIEWGWDSSASHRSLQLSEDIANGCIAVRHPIYVGMYSY